MTYTLAAAAKATGLNKWMVLRLIRSGEIPGTQDLFGDWHVEPAELHRLYPPADECHAAQERESGNDAAQQSLSHLEAAIATVIRDAGQQLRQQVDDARHDEVGHTAERHSRRAWWRRLAG